MASVDQQEVSSITFPDDSGKIWANGHAQSKEDGSAALLDNTSNFLAFGCIVLESSYRVTNETAPTPAALTLADLAHHLSEPLRILTAAGWLKVQHIQSDPPGLMIIRIWILPSDVGRRHIDRDSQRLRSALWHIIQQADTNPQVWQGRYDPGQAKQPFDPWATPVDASLFYMFNMLPSPSPDKSSFSPSKHKYVYEALEDLLEEDWFTGLQTALYPYQRRSAALMLQREERSQLQLDPRIEPRTAPDGRLYYYNPRDVLFFKEPLYYESCRGGILAETMGLGKTLICLALIISTKHHFPKMPSDAIPTSARSERPTLSDMVITSIQRKSLPWQVELDRIRHHNGFDDSRVRHKLSSSPATYEVPVLPSRWNRNTILPPPKRLILAATTIVVVPRNLCKQWHSEIQKHVSEGSLRLLVMEDLRAELPPADELRSYDLILFSRGRFELEIKDGSDPEGRRAPPAHTPLVCRCPYIGATLERACRCLKPEDIYDSPLKHLHFKRLIIDEGHSFSATNTKAVTVANKLVVADHRWIVSGTPARDLFGVEVDLVSSDATSPRQNVKAERELSLDARRKFSAQENQSGALKSLGSLASNFLQVRPWYTADSGEPSAAWDEYIYRHEDLKKRTYTSFSSSLQRTLEAMVVKTRPEDVERDIELPPLHHKVVHLEPSFYDKLTANLFTLVLTANAITSERTDQDYLFHKNSQKARYQLIANLRQSAFFWTGFSEDDVHASLKNSRGYLEKENTQCTPEDRALLLETMQITNDILASRGWKALSRTHELGLYIEDWPGESAEYWSFESNQSRILTGVSQVAEAQKHVNEQLSAGDAIDGLAGAGVRCLADAYKEQETTSKKAKLERNMLGVPSSSLIGEPILKHKSSMGKAGKPTNTRLTKHFKSTKAVSHGLQPEPVAKAEPQEQSIVGSLYTSFMTTVCGQTRKAEDDVLAEGTESSTATSVLQARIIGTTSAKLSYLTSQILKYYQQEKILVFYDGDNVAYYIAQMLEVLHIKHEIYAKSLAATLKSEYVVRFDQEEQYRVLLMDVNQAAFGLNVSSASRIYFVNPVCRPNVEAQAQKRAHRIGQRREVHVETLVLRGTIEEKMHERAKRMTRSEHLSAKVLEDDGGIQQIIQSARTIPLADSEHRMTGQIALLDEPQQLFARPGWAEVAETQAKLTKKRRRSTKD